MSNNSLDTSNRALRLCCHLVEGDKRLQCWACLSIQLSALNPESTSDCVAYVYSVYSLVHIISYETWALDVLLL